jgi:hypothetical protein
MTLPSFVAVSACGFAGKAPAHAGARAPVITVAVIAAVVAILPTVFIAKILLVFSVNLHSARPLL